MNEKAWDKLLRIRTTGRDDSYSDQYRFPYEPTPYTVLAKLADSGYITKKNVLIDYGCGKGRVGFFLSWQTRCRSIGIEFNERMYQAAWRNKENAVSGSRVDLYNMDAVSYPVPPEADRFYFFNPFSVKILYKVIGKILESDSDDSAEKLLFFYYPSDEYLAYLLTVEELTFLDEIDCRELFRGDDRRERILIFQK